MDDRVTQANQDATGYRPKHSDEIAEVSQIKRPSPIGTKQDAARAAAPRAFSVPVAAESFGKDRKLDGLTIGEAVDHLRQGGSVARAGWNGTGQYLKLQWPEPLSKMTLPYVYITTVHGGRVPWLASQTDLLEVDWVVVTDVMVKVFGTG